MHDDRRLVEDRLRRVREERLAPAVYRACHPLRLQMWPVPDEPVPVADALRASYAPVQLGAQWGRPWSTVWLRAEGIVPAEWAGQRVEAVFDLGFTGTWPGFQAEALVYDAAGRPLKGIHPENRYVPVARPASGGEHVSLLLEAAANPDVLGHGALMGDKRTSPDEPLYRLVRADLAVLDEEVWHLCLDLDVLAELMAELPTTDPRRHEVLRATERALDVLDLDDVAGSAAAARARLRPALASPANASAHRLSAVGHAHIDTAWLWPLRETRRKAARTFANVTALAAEYPELMFACSQAQQYAWIKQEQPEVFQRIREAVKAGQWVPVGGMWVESDANLPGGEALARQLVIGKRFFAEEFGVECRGVWLPDSFGYTAAFPQLARLAGMHWFLTQKLSWNQTNTMPHHTFWWEGIDGSRVFTHFPPVDTYNAVLSGAELARAVRTYAEKGHGTRSLVPFGYGNGGGGPTREMVERARRLRDLEGSPRVRIEHPDDFFEAAQAEYPHAPVWSGELYLERHRGTYTSQARTKAGNRRSEHLLREAELWATAAAVHAGAAYPYERLERLWRVVLLHQFHDILPGSSIGWVHREAEAAYEQTLAELEAITQDAVSALSGVARARQATLPWVFNAGPRARTEPVTIPGYLATRFRHRGQRLYGGDVAVLAEVPPSGAVRLDGGPKVQPAPVTVTERTLDNGLVRVELDGAGLMVSVRDLVAGRELLAPGTRGNLLQLHTDFPNDSDAWDIDPHYRRQVTDLTAVDAIEVVEPGPLVGGLRVARSFGSSRVEQVIRVPAGGRRVEVETTVDWQEREKLLKVAFPLDVHADRSAAEIQFGHVYRPTHANTGWDAAKFEAYGHRWLHVGEGGYGVAVTNDATYGHDVGRSTRPDGGTTTTVRLSLLRSPSSPDPFADQGTHTIGYALHPGVGIEGAVAEGYRTNLPLRVAAGDTVPFDGAFVDVDDPAATIEAVKLADDRSGDVVVRLYESLGGRVDTRLRTSFPIVAAQVVDLLERPMGEDPVPPGSGGVAVSLRPFQVVTLRLRREG
jgi:alpha-mannosidase